MIFNTRSRYLQRFARNRNFTDFWPFFVIFGKNRFIVNRDFLNHEDLNQKSGHTPFNNSKKCPRGISQLILGVSASTV